jgi:cephalosporin-C deacetylase
MPLFDWPQERLEAYRPALPEPADLADFWAGTLSAVRSHPLDVRLAPHPVHLPMVETLDLTFAGFGGQRVHGWYLRPRHTGGPVPLVVQFLGYCDGRGTPLEWLSWPAAGYATLVMDTRGQGARARRAGSTGDTGGSSSPHVEGFLTQGVLDPADYYYRRVFTDAVRAVEVGRELDGVDDGRVAVQGTSQGGGIALAASALADGVDAALVNVPFLCHFRRAVEITDTAPYAELVAFLGTQREHADRALHTLSYFDGAVLARLATAPALFSVALMDQVCPPSTVYAAYHRYGGPKELVVYPYNRHEGGGVHHDQAQIRWLQQRWA